MDTWSTWDVATLSAVTRPLEQFELRIGVYDARDKIYKDDFWWEDMVMPGPHSHTAYHEIALQAFGLRFTLEFASEEDRFVYKITPAGAAEHLRFHIAALYRWNAPGSLSFNGERITADTGKKYEITACGQRDLLTRLTTDRQGFLFTADGPVYVRCNHTMETREMDALLCKKRAECVASQPESGGALQQAAQAVVRGVSWNTVYDPGDARMCTPVSRRWCVGRNRHFGSCVLFGWDTFFCALLAGMYDRDLARVQIRTVLQAVRKYGFVPNFVSARGDSSDRSQPPVGSYCVLKLVRQYGDPELAEESFDGLLTWNRWWMGARDKNGDGLLELGSDPVAGVDRAGFQNDNMQAAKYESGLDNSPMYDDAVYNDTLHAMELSDVGMSALYALDCRALAELASLLWKTDEEAQLREEYTRMKARINEVLWDESAGIYKNRYWDGRWNHRLSPTCFYPMLAGIPTAAQAERMVREHLLNDNEFWGGHILPSIAVNDPAYGDQRYWRGRIWPPMNYLVNEGLKEYGFDGACHKTAMRGLELFLGEWNTEYHIHENYNAVTGIGNDRESDVFYTWGALLAYEAVCEWAEARAWDGQRFGSVSDSTGYVRDIPFGEDRYTVRMDGTLDVQKNGVPYIRCSVPVMIVGLREQVGLLSFEVRYECPGTLTVFPGVGIKTVEIRIGERTLSSDTVGGQAVFQL